MKKYDYIISGAGAAGLSLLMHMMQHRFFDDKEILVLDHVQKNKNDRTWCFWETEPGLFEPVVHHQWQKLHFYSAYFSDLLELKPYTYKMIRSIDFYRYVQEAAAVRSNITFKYAAIEALANHVDTASVIAGGEQYTGNIVFNSVIFSKPDLPAGKYYLLQHFKGWLIETAEPFFDTAVGTLMDFRVNQQRGTTFVYVLPVSENRALVEYTLFSKEVLPQHEYEAGLRAYIETYLRCGSYSIAEEEYGVIPMTNINFTRNIGRIINIGTAGGQTKASSGYTFKFIQKQSSSIVDNLVKHSPPLASESLFARRFRWYDSTLLNILDKGKLGGDVIFADLFKKNDPERVLRFLDNESDIEDELNIMGSVPSGLFIKAAFQEILR